MIQLDLNILVRLGVVRVQLKVLVATDGFLPPFKASVCHTTSPLPFKGRAREGMGEFCGEHR